jgi:STE24 endopeptidase
MTLPSEFELPGDQTADPQDADGMLAHADEMNAEQLVEAKSYAARKLFCSLADAAVDVAFLAVMAFVVARPLDALLAELPVLGDWWTRLAIFFAIVIAANLGVSFPLTYYSGFVLEHRFKLSRQTLAGWLWRYAKRNLLLAGFGLLLFEGLFLLIHLTGPYWWLAAAIAFFLVSVVVGQLVPVLILPLFYKIERLHDEQLLQRFTHLSAGTGLKIEGIYRMQMSDETAKANAMLTGLGRTRRVILGDTLIDHFSPAEIEVVLAHEIGHHVHRHIPKLILMGLVFSAASFYICDRILAAWVGSIEGTLRYDALPVYVLPLLMFTISVLSLLAEPAKNAVSRHFERQCDRYALQRTGLREAFRSAFHKLAKQNKADPNPHPLEVFLFHDHPPIAERLAMAEGLRVEVEG